MVQRAGKSPTLMQMKAQEETVGSERAHYISTQTRICHIQAAHLSPPPASFYF